MKKNGNQKKSAQDIAKTLLDGTKDLSKDSPFCTVLFSTSPWTVAEMQKLLPSDRYEFVTLDKLFAIADKAENKLKDISVPVFKFEP